jgi:hypothetical protein
MRRFAILGDDLMGYGKKDDAKKWWLDLEHIAGAYQIPKKR